MGKASKNNVQEITDQNLQKRVVRGGFLKFFNLGSP
jgi:hypothetical protein